MKGEYNEEKGGRAGRGTVLASCLTPAEHADNICQGRDGEDRTKRLRFCYYLECRGIYGQDYPTKYRKQIDFEVPNEKRIPRFDVPVVVGSFYLVGRLPVVCAPKISDLHANPKVHLLLLVVHTCLGRNRVPAAGYPEPHGTGRWLQIHLVELRIFGLRVPAIDTRRPYRGVTVIFDLRRPQSQISHTCNAVRPFVYENRGHSHIGKKFSWYSSQFADSEGTGIMNLTIMLEAGNSNRKCTK